MKRIMTALAVMLAAVAALAQAPQDDKEKIVATINGEVITKAKLDLLYNSMPVQMRSQYEKSGGKLAFLENYAGKRLMLQEAMKSGFDKRPDVQASVEAARESALFDKYIKETVVPSIVTEQEIRKYYNEHKSDFTVPESIKVRHIVITWNNKPQPEAMEQIKRVAAQIRTGAPSPRDVSPENTRILLSRFIEAARKYSEDAAAQSGGDLGWVTRGSLDKNFEEAAFAIKPMMMSGIVERQYGYHLIFVEGKKSERPQDFNEVKADIRDYLMTQHGADIVGSVKKLTNELRANSKVAFYPENVK